jgi:predicted GIY-YIG superfamily endonuclease
MSNWHVYMLVNDKGRTYIGSTTDTVRRLRQHNCEIKGGARSTSKHRPWKLYCYLSGFQTRSEACRWEKLIKSRGRGLLQREANFRCVQLGICPDFKSRPKYSVPNNLTLTWKIKNG